MISGRDETKELGEGEGHEPRSMTPASWFQKSWEAFHGFRCKHSDFTFLHLHEMSIPLPVENADLYQLQEIRSYRADYDRTHHRTTQPAPCRHRCILLRAVRVVLVIFVFMRTVLPPLPPITALSAQSANQ